MEWKGRRQSDNIEDQRGASPGGGNPFGRGAVSACQAVAAACGAPEAV